MKHRYFFLLLFCSLFISQLHGQEINVSLGGGVDTASNLNKKEVYHLWENYLNSNPDSVYNNPFWNESEKKQFNTFDLANSAGYLSPSLYSLIYRNGQNVVLSIAPYGELYIINSLFYYLNSDKSIYPLAIVNYIAKKTKNNYKLYNYLPFHTINWQRKQVGYFNYIYHKNHPFDIKKAFEANKFYTKLGNLLDFKLDTLTYYIAENCDKIYELQGFDYIIGKGRDNNFCGFFDHNNKIVYSNTVVGEDYRHEIIHIILKEFPSSGVFHLGIATYWGGKNAHFNKTLNHHIKRINTYLKAHPEINLNNFFEDFYEMDEHTSPHYIIAAIFCHLAIEQGGINKLKRLFEYGNSNEDFYIAIEKEFGLQRSSLNKFLRKKFEHYSLHEIEPIFQ